MSRFTCNVQADFFPETHSLASFSMFIKVLACYWIFYLPTFVFKTSRSCCRRFLHDWCCRCWILLWVYTPLPFWVRRPRSSSNSSTVNNIVLVLPPLGSSANLLLQLHLELGIEMLAVRSKHARVHQRLSSRVGTGGSHPEVLQRHEPENENDQVFAT